jgi:hypothetical protein
MGNSRAFVRNRTENSEWTYLNRTATANMYVAWFVLD